MAVKPLVGLPNQLAVKPVLADPLLCARDQEDGALAGIKREGRHTPFAAVNRSSFMLPWLEPFSVSTRGLPKLGPKDSNTWA